MFRGYWMLIRKLCKYLCAPANITEDTVAISQRFHVVKVWKIHTLENPLNKARRKCGSFAKPKFRNAHGSTRNEIHIYDSRIWNYRFGRPRHKFMPRGTRACWRDPRTEDQYIIVRWFCNGHPCPGGERQFAAGRGLAESNLHLFEPVQLLLW